MVEFLLGPEVAGRLGPQTELDASRHPPLVHRLHCEFEGWLGDELVQSFPCFLVTQRWAGLIRASPLTGAGFGEATVTKDPQLVERAELVVSERALRVLQSWSLNHCEVTRL